MKLSILKLVKLDLFKSFSVYTTFGIVQKAFPLLLIPFLTRVLSPADYGLIAMFGSVQAFFGPFVGLGSISSTARYYFDKDEFSFNVFLSSILCIVLLTTFIFGSILILNKTYISNLTSIPAQYIWIVVLVTLGRSINRLNQILFRVQDKRYAFALVNLTESALYFLLMLMFVYSFKLDWRSDIYTQSIIYSGLGVWGIFVLRKTFKVQIRYSYEHTKRALSYGIPIFVHSLGLFFVNMVDKLMLTNIIGIDATGIYNIGFKMAVIMVFFVTAFNNAYMPWLFAKLKLSTQESLSKAFKSTILICIAVFLFGLILLLIMPFAYSILIGKEFMASLGISRLIVFGEIFNSFYLIIANFVLFSKKTKFIMYSTLITSGLSIVLNYILITSYGIEGAAYTLIAVYFLKFVLVSTFTYFAFRSELQIVFRKINIFNK